MIGVMLGNLLAYSIQIAILIGASAVLVAVLKLTASARLRCLQLLLAFCVALPLMQPWRISAAKGSVTISTVVLANGRPDPSQTPTWIVSPELAIAAILVAGIAVRLAIVGVGLLRLRRYLERARLVPAALALEKQRVGAWPDVFVSEDLKGPVTFGCFRPVILIPARWIENQTIAYHELLHVRRRDWAFMMAEEFVRAVLWFHPAVWWLIARIQLAREEVVDREAVQLVESREQYLDTLLAVAEANAGLDLLPAPLFLKKRRLRQRVAALLKEVSMSKNRMRFSLAGFTLLLGAAGWLAVRSFPLQAAPQSVKDAPGVTVQADQSKLLHRASVFYPEAALEKGIQGTVLVQATLGEDGAVTDAQVVSGPPELRKAALESVLQWHYDKELSPGSTVQIPIDFALPAAGAANRVVRTIGANGTIAEINLSRLPEPLRDKAAARLPVHVGDNLDAQSMANLSAALSAIDEHLEPIIGRTRDGGIVVSVGLKSAVRDLGGAPQRIRVGGNAQATNLVEKVTPAYPPEAKQQRIQGTVRLTATIGKDGHIINLDVASGDPILAKAALEAVQQWVYRPTLLNGNPVEVITQIDVNFTLSN